MITLCMIVKNEEKYLRGCLESVKGVVDEIVVVDTGSTDKTVEIAKEYGAKIYFFEWSKDFSAARNFALEKCTHEWILYLDADERLMPQSREEVKKIGKQKNNCAYYCFITNNEEANNQSTLMAYVRYFPNKKDIRFTGKVHEQIIPALIRKKIRLNKSDIQIDHLGYDITIDDLKQKAARNLELLLKDYENNVTSYNEYQIAQTYGLLGDKEKAVEYFEKAIQDKYLVNEYVSFSYRYLSVYECEKGNYSKAMDYIEKGILKDPSQPCNLLAAAKIYLIGKDFNKVTELYKKAFQLNRDLVNKKTFTAQARYFGEKILLYDALSTALKINDKEMFNMYYGELIQISKKEEIGKEIEFLDALFNGKEISSSEVELYLDYVNKSNIDLIVNLLNTSSTQQKEILFTRLLELYPQNAGLLNKYGLYLITKKRNAEAKEILEKSFELKSEDSSIVFYLISLYLNTNDFASIRLVMEKALELYSGNYEFMLKFEILKQKLQGYV